MHWKTIVSAAILSLAPGLLHAQVDFRLAGRTVQFHGTVSQGFMLSDENNYMTMRTSDGSFAMTDGAANLSSQLTDNVRVGAQVYVRNIGKIGGWRPELDWAMVDYRCKSWLGFRGGKVKTTMGLHNDTQDMDSLHTWAILPQSIYPTDLRASTIAHVGGDVYGDIPAKRLGTFSWTVYAGERPQDPRGGYVLGLAAIGLKMQSYGGWQEGQDLRWATPIKGLLLGASLMNQHITGNGYLDLSTSVNPFLTDKNTPDHSLEREHSVKNDYYQYYLQYSAGPWRFEGEYRREWRDEWVGYYTQAMQPEFNFQAVSDARSWYGSGAYRASKWLEVGGYFSWYVANWSEPWSDPANHVYDKVATARFDLNSHLSLKVEGHWMDGHGAFDSIRGFYDQVNPGGIQPTTHLLVVRMGYAL